jgi:membrane-associated phospholipid phosphatase
MIILGIATVIVFILLAHELSRYAVTLILKYARHVPSTLADTQVWTRSEAFRSQLAKRNPALFRIIRDRIEPHRFTGLPLILVTAAALYLAALFSGLTEDILEADGIIRVDNVVNAAFRPWRIEPLVSLFSWITALGSSPAIVSAVIIATGFLWSQRRYDMIGPMWLTCLGAVATTSIGKFLIGRHRPESALDIAAVFFSFPSGHATAAMAVYGFLAYAIGRTLATGRERFEVGYWTAVLIGLIGLSRIVLGVHYVTDIAGGFLVGGFWLLIGFTIAEWARPPTTGLNLHPERLNNFPQAPANGDP